MATDEEYLDSLLKSMTDNEQNNSMDNDALDVSGMFDEKELSFDMQDLLNDDTAINEDALQMPEEESLPDSDDWKFSLDDILAQADAQDKEDNADELLDLMNWESTDQPIETEEAVSEESDSADAVDMDITDAIDDMNVTDAIDDMNVTDAIDDMNVADAIDDMNATDMIDDMDVTDLIDGMENADSDLTEINDLLMGSDKRETVDDDMLALLEGVDDTQMDSDYGDSDDIFDILAEDNLEEDVNFDNRLENQSGHALDDGKKKKRVKKEKPEKEKKKLKLFGKKKNEEEAGKSTETEEAKQGGFRLDSLLSESSESNSYSAKDLRKSKKQGLFSKVLTYLTQEEEEAEDLEEKKDEEQEQDTIKEKKKKKADKKGKKGKKGAKEKEQDEDALEEDGDEEKEGKSKAKKKPKKEKKEKPPKEKVKSEKILSTKNLLVLIAFCATIVASITVLGTFLPEFADKQNARDAFNEGDYDTAYKLLYDKKLDGSDAIIFNRAKVVLKLERKLQSYENNIALNRKLEAVDALMQGVACYYDLTSQDVYGARDELDALYQQICSILANNYGITPDKASEINAYDNVLYTEKLNSIVNGTEFSAPGEEEEEEEEETPDEPLAPQDILSEEENIISY